LNSVVVWQAFVLPLEIIQSDPNSIKTPSMGSKSTISETKNRGATRETPNPNLQGDEKFL
jgi:hypothetical protein